MGFSDTTPEADMQHIMVFPSGETNEDLLFDTIDEALHKGLSPTERISFLVHRRIRGFNPSDPQYETITESRTLPTLMRWYKNMTGHKFDQKFARPLPATMIPMLVHNPNTGATYLCDIGS